MSEGRRLIFDKGFKLEAVKLVVDSDNSGII